MSAYSGNPRLEKMIAERKAYLDQQRDGKYRGITSDDINKYRKFLYDDAARKKSAAPQGGAMNIGAFQGHMSDPSMLKQQDSSTSSTMYWDPENFKFVDGPSPGIRGITQDRGDLSGINSVPANTQVQQFNMGGEVPPMYNNKGLKKVTQKDRYGNTMSYEFEAPVKPLDPTALMKAQMEMDNEVPAMEMGMEGYAMPSYHAVGGLEEGHPGEPKGPDTVPAWLTPGEFVMNAEAVREYGPIIEQMNDHGRAIQKSQGGTVPEYHADGGYSTVRHPFASDDLLDALAQIESGGRHRGKDGELIESPAGAVGKYQWIPKYAEAGPGYGVAPFDPSDEDAQRAASEQYLTGIQSRNPDWSKEDVLRAYNWGPGNVHRHKSGKRKDMPKEAAQYPHKILKQLSKMRDHETYFNQGGLLGAAPPPLPEEEVMAPPAPRGRMKGRGPQQGEWSPEMAGGTDNRELAQAQRDTLGEADSLIQSQAGQAEGIVGGRSQAALPNVPGQNLPMGELPEEDVDPAEAIEAETETPEAIAEDDSINTVPNDEQMVAGAEIAEKDPGAMGRVMEAFGNAFSGLVDDDKLAEAAIMYLGSRALGYSHGGSLRWTSKNYLQRVQGEKAELKKNAYEFAKSGKYHPASVEEYKKSGDLSKLRPVKAGGNRTGEFKEFFKNGKKVRAEKVKVGDNTVWVGPGGQTIDSSYNQDAAFHKGTPEYRERRSRATGAAAKRFEEVFKREDRYSVGSGDNRTWNQNTRIGPEQASDEFWKWAEKNNMDPESDEALQVMTWAYEEAINEGQANPKAKPKRLTGFLDRARVRHAVGKPELFQTGTDKDGDPIYVRQEVMNQLENNIFTAAAVLPGTKGLSPYHQKEKVYNLALSEWSKLPADRRETYDKQAKKSGRSGFVMFTDQRLAEIMSKL